VGGGD